MSNVLVVVDMQNDFTTGALRNEDAIAVIPYIKKKLKQATENGDVIIFTRDMHQDDYMNTIEGKHLPVPHCIKGSKGFEIVDELKPYVDENYLFDKETFGSKALCDFFADYAYEIESIEFVGVCTDICVISNVMLTKAARPNTRIIVDAAGCAGVTKESHNTALQAMKACHIEVINE
ncbi:MAG: cysteine hydrolase [Pseudobutyrivibrio sp.]|nr:cysteine hydrolase [Pseudobutyrivibrio sp.]